TCATGSATDDGCSTSTLPARRSSPVAETRPGTSMARPRARSTPPARAALATLPLSACTRVASWSTAPGPASVVAKNALMSARKP
ncbi:hypothetical protein OC845_006761, partial [Tilletia horrida]